MIFAIGQQLDRIQEVIYQAAPLPLPAWLMVRTTSKIHWMWHFYNKKKLYQNPDNWFGLIAGHAANAYVGDGLIRTSAHLLLLATRIQEYAKEVSILEEEARRLADAIDGFYSPTLRDQMHQIYLCACRVFKSLFVVTMRAIDIYDAFYRRDEALNECLVNGAKWMELLTENKEELIAGLHLCQGQIETVLKRWSVQVDLTYMIRKLETGLHITGVSAQAYRSFSKRFGVKIKHMAARGAVAADMGYLVPDEWRPSAL